MAPERWAQGLILNYPVGAGGSVSKLQEGQERRVCKTVVNDVSLRLPSHKERPATAESGRSGDNLCVAMLMCYPSEM
eukprot:scaffold26810_cov142-Skeletonema_marinoi.AAC.15